MSKPWTPNRPVVELRTSRIRREPPPLTPVRKTVLPDDPEDQAWAVVVGMVAFALAITILIFWVSNYTSPGPETRAITITDVS